MTKTQIKSIALNASRQLSAVAKDIYNRDLVTAINHDQLKKVSAQLNDLYGVLDSQYQRSLKAGIDEPMEYIRPTRLKNTHVSPKQIVHLLDTEQQAMHHLLTLLDDIKIGA
ncbi:MULTISPECIES: hypothetical protein [unclassified Acinetobacter]|uniref:hypothetical protein n=1 Tax=unclassified Acinetobacter TaxID=196816 RepID=UPI002934FA34|nr:MULTISPECIES: hypothetical protein [unclassified Acinetobacter]WOE32967.1 hypothetical protein QSG84_07415 [Acinetobacter sp. SAAs470]WOE38444.1 hypothetical protein QSG86_16470 [Acinetobacter sp. SAAs474]